MIAQFKNAWLVALLCLGVASPAWAQALDGCLTSAGQEAVRNCENLIIDGNKDAVVYQQLISAYIDTGEVAKAKQTLKIALLLYRGHPELNALQSKLQGESVAGAGSQSQVGNNPDVTAPPSNPEKAVVSEVQRLLTSLGFNPGVADGVAGERSRRALQEFYQRTQLPARQALDEQALVDLRAEKEKLQNADLLLNLSKTALQNNKPQLAKLHAEQAAKQSMLFTLPADISDELNRALGESSSPGGSQSQQASAQTSTLQSPKQADQNTPDLENQAQRTESGLSERDSKIQSLIQSIESDLAAGDRAAAQTNLLAAQALNASNPSIARWQAKLQELDQTATQNVESQPSTASNADSKELQRLLAEASALRNDYDSSGQQLLDYFAKMPALLGEILEVAN